MRAGGRETSTGPRPPSLLLVGIGPASPQSSSNSSSTPNHHPHFLLWCTRVPPMVQQAHHGIWGSRGISSATGGCKPLPRVKRLMCGLTTCVPCGNGLPGVSPPGADKGIHCSVLPIVCSSLLCLQIKSIQQFVCNGICPIQRGCFPTSSMFSSYLGSSGLPKEGQCPPSPSSGSLFIRRPELFSRCARGGENRGGGGKVPPQRPALAKQPCEDSCANVSAQQLARFPNLAFLFVLGQISCTPLCNRQVCRGIPLEHRTANILDDKGSNTQT